MIAHPPGSATLRRGRILDFPHQLGQIGGGCACSSARLHGSAAARQPPARLLPDQRRTWPPGWTGPTPPASAPTWGSPAACCRPCATGARASSITC
ncbi:hypothetical protein ACPA9J_07925 [Pseudomonas aeruginosa]